MLRRTPAILLCLLVCLLAAQQLSQANSTLRIDESRVRLLLEGERPGVLLELDNAGGSAFKARASVELLDPHDKVRASAASDIEVRRGANRVTLAFDEPVKAGDREFPWYRLRYSVAPARGGAAAEGIVSVSKAAPDIFELRVVAPREARRGSRLRARVRASNPVAQRAAPGVAVKAELTVDVGDEETVIRAAATTDSEGLASLDFELPRGADDEAELKVTARRGAFVQTAQDSVSLEERPRMMLTTDKSIYQPGQTMHIRALVLDPSERAAAGDNVSFQIEDEEGTTVFRAAAETSRFGVASADWPVPESARLGEYSVRLEPDEDKYSQDYASRTAVRVSRYELPNFSVSAKGDRPFYLPGQDAEVEVRGDYLFGQPLKRGRVRVVRETERRWNWREQKYETKEGEEVSGALDEGGRFVARLPLAAEHATLAESGWLRFDDLTYAAYVTDPTTDRTEQRRFALRLTKEPVHVYVNEGRNRQAPGLPLAFYVGAFYADGSPAQCDVVVTEEGPTSVSVSADGRRHEVREPDRTVLKVRTNRYGVAKVAGPVVRPRELQEKLPLRFAARDREGREGRHAEDFWLSGADETDPPELRVETDKTLYRTGEPVAVRLSSSRPRLSVIVETWVGGRSVSSRPVRLTDGRAALVVPYEAEFRNGVTVTAVSAEPFGNADDEYAYGARTVVYPRSRELKLDANFSRASYQPGDEAEVKFAVRSSEGRRAESALGVVVFDKAVEERARTDAEGARPFGFYSDFHGFWYSWDSIAGFTRRDIERLDAARAGAEGVDEVADLLYNGYRGDPEYNTFGGVEFESDQRQLFRAVVGARLAPVRAALEKSYAGGAGAYPTDEAALARILSAAGVDFGALKDPWGQPFRASFSLERNLERLHVISDGADEQAGTEDDFAADTFSWPYFRPVGQRLDRAAAEFYARANRPLPDLPALKAELLREGFDLDALRDRWGQPYAFDFDVRGAHHRITARSGGPNKTLQPKDAPSTDDFELWTTLTDYFAARRAAVDNALREWAHANGVLPQNPKALAGALAKAGLDLNELRDGWGRPVYPTFKMHGRYADRAATQAGAAGHRTQSQPVTQVVHSVQLRSAGADGREGTPDDFDLAHFSGVTAEQTAAGAAPRPVTPATTYAGATGAITGAVIDVNGAAVADALVKVRHKQTGLESEARANDEGVYLVRNLPSGFYQVSCSSPGFVLTTVDEVQVQSSNLTRLDLTLHPGGVSEAVTVTADTSASVNATSASVLKTVTQSGGPRVPLSTPRLREFFPETLVWQPSVETDREGRAVVRFKLADNITTWKMSVIASTEDGRVGLFEKEILSFQPFFAEHDPPRVLTEGDEISLPVVVRNYLDRAQAVQVEMKPEAWFALKGPARQQTQAPAGDVARPTFDFRAVASIGEGRQRVTAYGADASDAVEKPVTVHPDGEERAETAATVFAASAALEASVPADAVPGSLRSELKIYPNLTAHLLEGVEAIMQRPYGCGEQTVSSAYPSVYVLNYYRQSGNDLGGDLPADMRRAERYARLGYERLLGYRAEGGGFTYWGRGEADLALTAYALRFLKDASEVVKVDHAVVKETRDWLVRRQRDDGTWPAPSWAGDQVRQTTLTTAFVARVLAALQKREPAGKTEPAASAALARALRHLAARSEEWDEPYLIASYALAASDAGDGAGAARAVGRLRALARDEGGAAFWALETNTPFYGWGRAGRIETTALAVQALARDRAAPDARPAHNALLSRGLLFLLRNKDRHGVWLSTQATVNVLDALLGLAAEAPARADGGRPEGDAAEVFVNGKRAGEIALPPPARLSGPVLFDLSPFVAPGANRVEVRRRGTPAQAQAQLVTTYYVPWQRANQAADPQKPSGASTLRLAVSYDRPTAETGQEVTCSVEAERVGHRGYGMMLAEVGLPPGADVDRASLERAVKESGYAVNSYDVRPDRLVLYLWPKGGGTRLSFKFRPRYGLNALTAPSQIYDYYNPDSRAVLPPTRFVVR